MKLLIDYFFQVIWNVVIIDFHSKDLREAFRIFDKDKSGYIDGKEIIEITGTLGQALTDEELEAFMAEADLDGDGKLDYNEFVQMMTKS